MQINTITENMLAFNTRTILYFGGNFWVIDQPSDKGMVWLANSPIGRWTYLDTLKLKLYGSEETEIEGAKSKYIPIVQNADGDRYDYKDDKYLNNFWYAIQDNNAVTYVMTYSVNDEGFEKTTKKCPANFQCFRNKKDDKRLIVPPYKKKYTVASVLGNCYKGYKETDGIMLAIYNRKEGVWEYKVINGTTYGEENVAYLPGAIKLLLLSR